MNKILHFQTSKEKNVFFSSDWHVNHLGPRMGEPLFESRGFASASDMTSGVINNINEKVKPNDDLIYLGDFCLDTTESQFESILSRIYCQNIYMLWGNHNSCVKDAYKLAVMEKYNDPDIEVYPIRYRNIIFIGSYLECTVNKQKFCLCHYPLISWNKMRHNTIHLHGHCHGNLNPPLKGKVMDISWDIDKTVYSFDDIKKIMDKRSAVGDGGHH